jgi:peptidoglycan/xylan/chitin deacetylase (PgdA/CDA1 family)
LNTGVDTLPLRWCASRGAPVLTYHACFDEPPAGVAAVDNVSPACIYDQISALKKIFTFVSIDEFCAARLRKGIAAITFDDGYKCVIDNALPVFSTLNVPFAVFVNSSSFERKAFWRYKLTYLVQSGLSREFEASLERTRPLRGKSLLEYSKDPANHSAIVEEELDRYLASKGIAMHSAGYLFDDTRYLVAHPLVWYGNHSHNHYVLSSLSRAEQDIEIGSTQRFLARFPQIQISNVFAAPFGQAYHINRDTLAVLGDLGYRSVLLNRGGVNSTNPATGSGVAVIHRMQVEQGNPAVPLKKEYVRSLLNRQ